MTVRRPSPPTTTSPSTSRRSADPYEPAIGPLFTTMAYDKALAQFYAFLVENLEPIEETALLLEAENRVKARIARARALMEQVAVVETPRRPPIPDDVKVLVWQRDKGRCVCCGSNQNLEFDHIIAVSLGGATTFRNLQLLCEPCNRKKSGSLT